MATPAHLRLTMSGDIRPEGVKVEEFSFRVNIAKSGPLINAFNADSAADLAADAVAFFNSAGTGISAHAVLTQVKLASIGGDGLYTDEPFVTTVSQTGGSGSAMKYPPQISLAVSLVTERRGPTGKGRFYLPLPTQTMDSAGQLTAGAAEAVRGSVVTFLDNINNSAGLDLADDYVCVASSKGYLSKVTGVRIGRTFDTIRTRREDLDEKYTAVAALA